MTPLTGQALVEVALTLATKAHRGQTRADGVTPYLEHPLAVEQEFLVNWGNVTCDLRFDQYDMEVEKARGRAIALLHDTLERDCAQRVTTEDLRALGFKDLVPELTLLTHAPEDTYLDYILRLRGMRVICPLAYYVKLADLAANMATVHMVPNEKRRRTMLTKWQLAQWVLRS